MGVATRSLLVVGAGSIGERHLRCFLRTGRVQPAICEINAELRRRIAERYEIDRAYPDLNTALGDSFDAAVICTPAHLHLALARALAEAGMHVLIEKPLGTSLEGIAELKETLRRKRLVAAMAYVLRCHPSLRAMREAIRSGRFGRPLQLVTCCGQHFPTFRPAYREIYYKDRATGGGAIQDALAHQINAGEWIVGPIDRLTTDAAHQGLDGVEVEDTVGVLARHGGVLGFYALNQYQAPNEITTTVVCQRGTARWELHRHRWMWMETPNSTWQEESAGEIQRDDLFVDQANAFLDAIEGRRPPVCTLQEGIQTQRAIQAALESAEQGEWRKVEGEE